MIKYNVELQFTGLDTRQIEVPESIVEQGKQAVLDYIEEYLDADLTSDEYFADEYEITRVSEVYTTPLDI